MSFRIPLVLPVAALLASVASAQSLPSAYDLRAVASGSGTVAWVPAIQDQGIFNDCWTFASATAIESNLLKNGFFGPAPAAPPPVQISSWHISTRNGAPESVVSTGTYSNGTVNYGWGGFEYQTMGYLTRGQGAWAIPNVPTTNSQNYISTMGGGPVLVSGSVNAFPAVLVNNSPANIADLLPAANQTPAFQTRGVTFLDQGFSNNIPLPTPHGSTKIDGTWYSKYQFDQGAADPQVQAVKQAILTYGAVTTSVNANYNYFHYVANSGTAPVPYTVQYVNPTELTYNTDHEVTIIGWNDAATIASATSGTTYTGAWIVQNSWGTNYWTSDTAYDNDGTFLAPYDDPSIGRVGVAAFTMGATAAYSQNVLQNELGPIGYAYDYNATSSVLGMAADEHTTVASVLTPSDNGSLVAVGVATAAANTSLAIDIYSAWSGGPSGALLASSTVALSGIGYQLVDLAAPVPLIANQGLAVVLTYGTSGAAPVVVGGDGLYGVTTGSTGLMSYPVASGLSYYRLDDGTWVDFATKQYTATSGDGSADTLGGVVFLKGIVAVPEPSTLAISLTAIACTVWGAARRCRRRLISVLSVAVSLGLLVVGSGSAAAQSGYTSPFSITFDPAIGSWTTDFATRQAAIDANTSPRIADWYFPTVYSGSNYPYGPLNPQLYSSATIGSGSAVTVLQYDRGVPVLNVTMNAVPGGVDPTTWQQQRILAAANVLLQAGTPYQHLHLPNFDPAQVTSGTGFPWSAVSTGTALQSSWQLANNQSGTTPNPYFAAYGKPTTGIDCTDFTAYVYNLALGIQMHSGTPNQIEFGAEPNPTVGGTATATVLDSSGNAIQPQFFYGPNFGQAVINGAKSLDSLVSQFQTGDLLYIGNPHDGIRHVVMWLGQNYVTASGTIPLVISSHDNTPAIFDTVDLDPTGFPSDGNIAGHLPPPGVHILPFDASNWFYQDFQVAMRVVAVPEPSTIALAGLACGAFSLWRGRRRAAHG